jgi:hypothetical protein
MAVNENYYTILTSYGKQKLAEAQASGTTLQLTEFAVGDANGSYYAPNETQTTLVNEVYRAQINRITTDSNNPNWIIIEGIIPADQGGWTIREVGVFDADGNLVLIGNYPETYKPVLTQGAGNDLYVRIIMEVENIEAVELKIDPAIVLASRKYVDDEIITHNADETSHNIPGQISTAINNHDSDESSHIFLRNKISFRNKLLNGNFKINQRYPTHIFQNYSEKVIFGLNRNDYPSDYVSNITNFTAESAVFDGTVSMQRTNVLNETIEWEGITRIKFSSLTGPQVVWKTGGVAYGVGIGIDGNGNFGLFVVEGGAQSSATIPVSNLQTNVWYIVIWAEGGFFVLE